LAYFVKKITKFGAGRMTSAERTRAVVLGAIPPGLEPGFDLATYYPIFLYLVAILGFAGVTLLMAHWSWLKPQKRSQVKLMPYESGMDPVGDARQHFDVKFYLIAILFLVFDVELLFLYPWAVTAYREQGTAIPGTLRSPVFLEVLVFLFTLVVAYVYAWRKGVFKWR
jgi:NADH:ubiquinone oxidoreductase subunit 3 (subunit A)